ncbi:MAG: MTAP family purine nucleoside phosphorylase [Armatimonadota bacterium]
MAEAIAVIGGTGVGSFPVDRGEFEHGTIATHWGDIAVSRAHIDGSPVWFLPRHGYGHRRPPHGIPHRAHVSALCRLGVRAVLATAAVGGLRPGLAPGTLMVPDDLVDLRTRATERTLYETQVAHTDMTHPFDPGVRAHLTAAAKAEGIPVEPVGTYFCVDGPRYETPAEVRLYGRWGGDIVGMTVAGEAILCREAGLSYGVLALVTNPGAGLDDGRLSHEDVVGAMAEAAPRVARVLARTARSLAQFPPTAPTTAGVDLWDEPTLRPYRDAPWVRRSE